MCIVVLWLKWMLVMNNRWHRIINVHCCLLVKWMSRKRVQQNRKKIHFSNISYAICYNYFDKNTRCTLLLLLFHPIFIFYFTSFCNKAVSLIPLKMVNFFECCVIRSCDCYSVCYRSPVVWSIRFWSAQFEKINCIELLVVEFLWSFIVCLAMAYKPT